MSQAFGAQMKETSRDRFGMVMDSIAPPKKTRSIFKACGEVLETGLGIQGSFMDKPCRTIKNYEPEEPTGGAQ